MIDERLTAVVIPTYISSQVRFDFFKQTIASLVRQNRPVVGLVIDDDSPMSNEVRLVVDYFNTNGNLRYVNRQKKDSDLHTASNALNLGLELVLGKNKDVFSKSEIGNLNFVAYLHSDDLLPVDGISKRVDAIRGSDFVFSKMMFIDEFGKPKSIYGNLNSVDNYAFGFPHHSSLWSLNFLKDVKTHVQDVYGQEYIFDSRICCGEDRDVSLSSLETLKKSGRNFTFIPSISYFYRAQSDSITANSSKEDFSHDHKIISDKHGFSNKDSIRHNLFRDIPWSLFYFLPPSIKKQFRGPRDFVKKVLNPNQFDEYSNDPFLNY